MKMIITHCSETPSRCTLLSGWTVINYGYLDNDDQTETTEDSYFSDYKGAYDYIHYTNQSD